MFRSISPNKHPKSECQICSKAFSFLAFLALTLTSFEGQIQTSYKITHVGMARDVW